MLSGHLNYCALVFIGLSCVINVHCSPIDLINYDIWGDQAEQNHSSLPKRQEQTFVNSSQSFPQIRSPRVLNFFPIPVEEECKSRDGRRIGICMNTYECRIRTGASHGPCALGFGVCCVFTATCDTEIINNITYFVNPHFPDLSRNIEETCGTIVKKIDPEIAQLRLDFIHFNLGQPNRQTGVCDDDVFIISGGSSRNLHICGVNSGQHVYFDVEEVTEPIQISMRLGRKALPRLWEVRILQIHFSERAPPGCLQYHTGQSGVIQTLNFADNGRHLANQDYNICMRQEEDMCSIAYEPCDENSFKIGPSFTPNSSNDDPNPAEPTGEPGIEPGTSSVGPTEVLPEESDVTDVENGIDSEPTASDVLEDPGSGDGQLPATPNSDTAIHIEQAELEQQEISYEQDDGLCSDRIVMPCDFEDLIMPQDSGPGYCEIVHCGNSFCPPGETPCRVESSVTPFTIGVQFGPSARAESPEDNLGMCLRYEQQTCTV